MDFGCESINVVVDGTVDTTHTACMHTVLLSGHTITGFNKWMLQGWHRIRLHRKELSNQLNVRHFSFNRITLLFVSPSNISHVFVSCECFFFFLHKLSVSSTLIFCFDYCYPDFHWLRSDFDYFSSCQRIDGIDICNGEFPLI